MDGMAGKASWRNEAWMRTEGREKSREGVWVGFLIPMCCCEDLATVNAWRPNYEVCE